MWKVPTWRVLTSVVRLRHYSTNPEVSAALLQLLDVTKESISHLKTQFRFKTFEYPYKGLNRLDGRKARDLLEDFEKSLLDDYKRYVENETPQPFEELAQVTVADYFRPQMPKASPILFLVHLNRYPDELAEIKGYKSKREIVTGILTSLLHEHHLGQIIAQDPPKTGRIETYWDIRNPIEWYPNARKMKRKIIMHVGPTNSGKTHNALESFRAAKVAYYAGPLRLLAREIYERFNAEGTHCNLVTGEEIVPVLDRFGRVSTLSSGTIEMVPLHTKMDVCVIDEIQMIADKQRGAAWTSAVLGVQAKELHLCGEERAVECIRNIAKLTGDTLEVKRYTRLGKLTVEQRPVGNVHRLRRGDCVVAFSKKKILQLKCEIEELTDLRVGIVYGALPPEIRSQEAAKFNNGTYDVLVASDAVGMGLNLKIRRVVFWSTQKFNGTAMEDLSISATKQIAGRAGRYSSSGELEGFVTTRHADSLSFVTRTMRLPVEDIKRACVWPPMEFWTSYAALFGQKLTLSEVVERFEKEALRKPMEHFFLSDFTHQNQILALIESNRLRLFLTLEDQLKLSLVPVNLETGDSTVRDAVNKFFWCILEAKLCTVEQFEFLNRIAMELPVRFKNNSIEVKEALQALEVNHKLVLVFMWLSQRWPRLFVDRESAQDYKLLIEKRIAEQLICLRLVSERERENNIRPYKRGPKPPKPYHKNYKNYKW